MTAAHELAQAVALFALLAGLVLVAARGYQPGPLTDEGLPTYVTLSFVWYPWIGGLVAFFFGWLLSDPLRYDSPDSQA